MPRPTLWIRHPPIIRLIQPLLAMLALAACDAGAGPDRLELDNMSWRNVVPKSSPAAFTGAFERFCLDGPGSAQALDAPLRAAGYVPVPGVRAGRPRTYLIDDRRPAVVVSDAGCMVVAASRTGQTDRTRALVAARFPDARPVAPTRIGKNVEQAWALPPADGRVLFTLRQTGNADGSRYALAVSGRPRPRRN